MQSGMIKRQGSRSSKKSFISHTDKCSSQFPGLAPWKVASCFSILISYVSLIPYFSLIWRFFTWCCRGCFTQGFLKMFLILGKCLENQKNQQESFHKYDVNVSIRQCTPSVFFSIFEFTWVSLSDHPAVLGWQSELFYHISFSSTLRHKLYRTHLTGWQTNHV